MDNRQLTAQMTAFGVTSTEAQLYLHLVDKPPRTVLAIATELNRPRTSVYDDLQKLADKGLVERVVRHKSHAVRAYPITILQAYIDEQQAHAEALQRKLAVLQQNLPQVAANDQDSEVRYYYGAKGLEQMVWNTLKTKDELIGYSQFSLTQVVSQHFVDKYNLELKARGIRNRIITNPENVATWRQSTKPVEDYAQTLQQCRTVDIEKLRISGDTTIYNNIFAVAYWEQGEVLGVEIEQAEIAKIQRSIFELLWTQSTPTTSPE
jgi:sugar-specific transcriptional regulator TrmB